MPGISLRFPKMVEIQNPRLIILYYTIQLGTCSFLLWWFITQKFWDKEIAIGSYIGATLSVSPMGLFSPEFQSRVEVLQRTLCAEASKHTVWADAEGVYVFDNMTCQAACTTFQGCTDQQDAFLTIGDSEVFVPTSRSVASRGVDNTVLTTNQFLLTPEAISVNFAYFFDIPKVDFTGNARLQRLTGSSDHNLGTYLYADDGSQQGYFAPGEDLRFSVGELLRLSGHSGILDQPNSQARNRRPGAGAEDSPIGRISGIELLVSVDCNGAVGAYRHTINQCSLSVHKSERGWVYERILDVLQSGNKVSSVFYTGIRIKVQGHGMGNHWDIGTLVSKITTCLVLMTLPKRLCMVLCTYLLGHLSVIYRQAIYDKFQLREALAGMSARLLVWNTAFVDLIDSESPGNIGISKRRILERLNALLKNRSTELDAGEINHLCEFCHSALLKMMEESQHKNHLGKQLQRQLQDVTDEIAGGVQSTVAAVTRGATSDVSLGSIPENRVIDSDIFSTACTSSENLNFDAVVKLFDVQRRRSFIERVFTPRELGNDLGLSILKNRKQDDDSSSESSAGDCTKATTPPDPPEGWDAMDGEEAGAVLPDARPSLIRRDASGNFTLEEERELRKNLHKKVAQLLEAKTKLFDAYDDIKRIVHDHRQHFDTRHREHYSKVVQESEVSQKRIKEVEVDFRKSHKNLEERVADLTGQNASLSTLNRVLQQRLDAIELKLRQGLNPERQPTPLPLSGRESADQPTPLPLRESSSQPTPFVPPGRESTHSSVALSGGPMEQRSSTGTPPRQPPHLSPPLPSATPNPSLAATASATTSFAGAQGLPSQWSVSVGAGPDVVIPPASQQGASGSTAVGGLRAKAAEAAGENQQLGPGRPAATIARNQPLGPAGSAASRPSMKLAGDEVSWSRSGDGPGPVGEGPWKSRFLATLTTTDQESGLDEEGGVQSL